MLEMPRFRALNTLLAMNIDKRWTYFPPVPPSLCVSSFWFSILALLAILAIFSIYRLFNP